MRTLRKMKLIAISALLVLGVSSCLKVKEPDFAAGLGGYIIQINQGETARFQPYFIVQSNEPASMSLQGPGLVSYPLKSIDEQKTYYVSDLYSDGMFDVYPQPTDTLPRGTFTLTATNAKKEVVYAKGTFDSNINTKLGEIKVTEFVYTASDGSVSAKWEAVTNAKEFLFTVMKSGSPYRDAIRAGMNDGKLTFTPANFTNGDRYNIYVTAVNDAIQADSKVFSITIGTDYSEK